MAPITYLSADDPPALLNYGYANVPLDANSSMGLIVHHPLLGIALKEQMDKLGIECIVQYAAGPSDRHKVRHNSDKPIVSPVEFITLKFDKADSDGARQSGTPR